MGLLNRVKYIGGTFFVLGCIVMWVSFFGPELIYSWIPSQVKTGVTYLVPSQALAFLSDHLCSFFSNPVSSWENGAWLSIFGFAIFISLWVTSKARSKYGWKYRDWRAKSIAKKMGVSYVLTIFLWIVSIMYFKTDPSLAILESTWPQEWFTGFLLALIILGLYMRKIRPGQKSLLTKIKDILVPIFIVLIMIGGIVGGVVWLDTGSSPPTSNTTESSDIEIKYYEMEKDVFAAINEERIKNGLGPVKWNDQVAMAARKHSKNMAEHSFFSHISPQGTDLTDRLSGEGIRYHSCGEIIFKQSRLHGIFIIPIPKTPGNMVNAAIGGWMDSPGHKAIILTSSFEKAGIGIWKEDLDYYFTADFIN